MNQAAGWRKTFFAIYIGQAFSILSSSAVQFAIIWWITVNTGSVLAITVAAVAGLLPQALVGPFAGVWIDRFNRRTVMMLADGVVALGSFLLFVMCFAGSPPLWLVYLILAVRSLGETFHKPALSAAIPQLVPREDLMKAGGLGQMVSSACSIAGPMLGALLMSVASLQLAMLVDIVGAVFAILILSRIRIPRPVSATGASIRVFSDMRKGFAAIRQNKPLMRIFIPFFLTTIIFTPIGTMLPLMVKHYFGGGAWQSGLVQTLFSVGMLLCAGVLGVVGGMKKQFRMISVSITVLGVAALCGGLLPSTLFWAFCACVFVIGGAAMCFHIPFTTYVQKSVPEENLGKVMSLMTSVLSFAAPVGMFISGPVANAIGVSRWMTGAGVLIAITGVLAYGLTHEFDKERMTNEEDHHAVDGFCTGGAPQSRGGGAVARSLRRKDSGNSAGHADSGGGWHVGADGGCDVAKNGKEQA